MSNPLNAIKQVYYNLIGHENISNSTEREGSTENDTRTDGGSSSETDRVVRTGGGNSEQGKAHGNSSTSDQGSPGQPEREKPLYSNGDEVTYKGEKYVVNGVGHELDTGSVVYDLDNKDGETIHEQVPESDLTNPEQATEPPEATQLENEADLLRNQIEDLTAEAENLRNEASTAPKKERFKLYGRAGALKRQVKALKGDLENLESKEGII